MWEKRKTDSVNFTMDRHACAMQIYKIYVLRSTLVRVYGTLSAHTYRQPAPEPSPNTDTRPRDM